MSKNEAQVGVGTLHQFVGGFDAAFFPDCQWCVLSPWIATLDGKPYRLHCVNDCTEEEARHIAYQLNRYARPEEERRAYSSNPTGLETGRKTTEE